MGKPLWTLFQQPNRTGTETMAACKKLVDARLEFKLDFMVTSMPDNPRLTASFRPAASEALSNHMPLIGIPGFAPWEVRH